MASWSWSVEGAEVPTGTKHHSFADGGTIEAELAGGVVVWLAERGPFWDSLDTTQPFTLRVEMATPPDGGS